MTRERSFWRFVLYRMRELPTLMAVITVVLMTVSVARAQTLTTLYSFCAQPACTDGTSPQSKLVQDANGNLYGTTLFGGAANDGTVYKISTTGQYTILHSFCTEPTCLDGRVPYAGLVMGADGNLYGATSQDGGPNSGGTLFKLTLSGTLTTLHRFVCTVSNCPEGSGPSSLMQASNGDLYGTTEIGTSAAPSGTIFKFTGEGKLTTLYVFCTETGIYCATGENPNAPLVEAKNGDFYGTTYGGGEYGFGTVFRITPQGTLTSLHSFCAEGSEVCPDGQSPSGGLVRASNGDFYGTTSLVGGTVYKMTPTGKLTTLVNFCTESPCPDGTQPSAGLIQATDGNLYGATGYGGANGFSGTIFQLTLNGTLTTLYSFCTEPGCPDGSHPFTTLMQGHDGDLYGTTYYGGADNSGTVFSFSLPPGSIVRALPTSGSAESPVGL
jgi:uncharacterized repeat protein (TIGR03803 family)